MKDKFKQWWRKVWLLEWKDRHYTAREDNPYFRRIDWWKDAFNYVFGLVGFGIYAYTVFLVFIHQSSELLGCIVAVCGLWSFFTIFSLLLDGKRVNIYSPMIKNKEDAQDWGLIGVVVTLILEGVWWIFRSESFIF